MRGHSQGGIEDAPAFLGLDGRDGSHTETQRYRERTSLCLCVRPPFFALLNIAHPLYPLMMRPRSAVATIAALSLGSTLALAAGCAAQRQPAPQPSPAAAAAPRVFALRPEALAASRARVRANDARLAPAYRKLLADAEKELTQPNVAVTDRRAMVAPSGDRHDYLSLSPYWWPDPSKPDGLPYIRRDGETNPESKRDLDQPRVARLGNRVQTLALAYYLSGDEKYARAAASQLRTWFLDPATRMNPHLRFAQLVRGLNEERGSGIIDTRPFIESVDAAGLLEGSASWTAADQAGMRDWARQYLRWLWDSPNGTHERAARNNHGSWYAAQTASLALFTGDTALARRIISGARERIGWQIQPDGNQPIEMERTRSLHYSGFNVEALARLAEMGRHLGIDLWGYQAPEGGSIRRALDHMAPYFVDRSKWPGQQLDDVDLDARLIQLRRGQTAYPDAGYARVLDALAGGEAAEDRSILLYPGAR